MRRDPPSPPGSDGSVGGWRPIQRVYLLLTLLTTLAASLIWGINTLFLLDAGLSNTEAFAANAVFTAGLVVSEVPTGVVADTRGRRTSFLWGAGALLLSTLLYLAIWWIEGPFWAWALASALIGLGFSFFSGAVEAWLVDALTASGFHGDLESVFARGQVVSGAAMLTGTVGGGLVAQLTNLGVPYLLRAGLLAATLAVAARSMWDLGFRPAPAGRATSEVRRVLRASVAGGLGDRRVRWLMLAAPFTAGVGIYAFYAMQPYLLDLYGDEDAFVIAGTGAAIVAGSQILGGLAVPMLRRVARLRTSALIGATVVGAGALALVGATRSFWAALLLLAVWSLTFSASRPIRQAYLNGVIPSEERATVLSFDSLMGSAGGVVAQPALGRLADTAGYPASYLASAVLTGLAVPFLVLARRERAAADVITHEEPVPSGTQAIPPETLSADARVEPRPGEPG